MMAEVLVEVVILLATGNLWFTGVGRDRDCDVVAGGRKEVAKTYDGLDIGSSLGSCLMDWALTIC